MFHAFNNCLLLVHCVPDIVSGAQATTEEHPVRSFKGQVMMPITTKVVDT